MEQINSVVTGALEFLSSHPGAYLVIAALVAGLFGIAKAFVSRGGLDWLIKRKRRTLVARLKRICPHIEVECRNGTAFVESLCNSVGSSPWVTCRLCGRRFTHLEQRTVVDRWARKSSENLDHVQAEPLQKAVALRERLDEMDGE